MNDIAAALSSILGSQDGIEQVKSVASMLGMNPSEAVESLKNAAGASSPQPSPSVEQNSSGGNPFDGIDLNMLFKLKGLFDSQQKSSDTQLLDALKPYLSEGRSQRIEDAKRIMKLMDLIPLISQLGLFNQ